jgi:hypothetical protein
LNPDAKGGGANLQLATWRITALFLLGYNLIKITADFPFNRLASSLAEREDKRSGGQGVRVNIVMFL